MLSHKISKTGTLVLVWSIPAWETCKPGRTPACRVCYARTGHFLAPSVSRRHRLNYEQSRSPHFVDWMLGLLREQHSPGRVVRIHGAGDFYSRRYARKWLKICRAAPDIDFYLYSRSWQDEAIRRVLEEIAKLANVWVWWSADRHTVEPPRTVFGICYLALTDDDVPAYPVDLVFRARPRGPAKFDAAGNFVCPYEQKVVRRARITCSSCRICFSRELPRGRAPAEREPAVTHPEPHQRWSLPLVEIASAD